MKILAWYSFLIASVQWLLAAIYIFTEKDAKKIKHAMLSWLSMLPVIIFIGILLFGR